MIITLKIILIAILLVAVPSCSNRCQDLIYTIINWGCAFILMFKSTINNSHGFEYWLSWICFFVGGYWMFRFFFMIYTDEKKGNKNERTGTEKTNL